MNTNMISKNCVFEIRKRATDGWFNATDILKQWATALGSSYTIEEFVRDYLPFVDTENLDRNANGDIFLPPRLEQQLRFAVANYDFDLYDGLAPAIIVWLIEFEMEVSAPEPTCNSYKTYLMLDESCGAIKIGRSRDPKVREHTLCAQIPRIKLLAVCPKDVEKQLHEKYKDKRMRGEWFRLSQDDIKSIIRQYKFERLK